VAREACGACHMPIIYASERSMMASGAMLWGGGAYNNGILPFKRYLTGEHYSREGVAGISLSPGVKGPGADLRGEPRLSPEQVCQIIALACEQPGGSGRPISQWSHRELADEIVRRGITDRISPRHASRLLKSSRPAAAPRPIMAYPSPRRRTRHEDR